MNPIKLHIVFIPLTGVGLHDGFRGQEWYKERVEVFKRYTLKSLENQTDQQFILWLGLRDEERINPVTMELADYLAKTKLNSIFTFNGLPYYDDKFGLTHAPMNIARVIRDWYRGHKISIWQLWEVFQDKNKSLKTRLQKSLDVLYSTVAGKEVSEVYLTRVDSDDMFARGAFETIMRVKPFQGAITCRKGFIYNDDTKQLAEWLPKTNPPFHTIIYPAKTFFDAARHMEYLKGFKSHEDIPKILDTYKLPDGMYCVLTHNPKNHISTTFDHPFKGKEITDSQKQDILSMFGI